MQIMERCAIIGLGLIGGSFGAALKAHGLAKEVVGVDRCQNTLSQAKSLGVIDHGFTTIEGSLTACSHVFLATPVGTFFDLFDQIASQAESDAVVIDFGSVKGQLSFELHERHPQLQYIPAHPIAGSEKSGIGAADANLFRGKKFIVTPFPDTPSTSVNTLRQWLCTLGAHVVAMDPLEHDRVFAAVSHLPHMIAYGLVGSIATLEERWKLPLSDYPGAGFRDFTRIASSDETMWADIALANADEIVHCMEIFQQELVSTIEAIQNNDRASLLERFGNAREFRDAIVKKMEKAHA